MAKQKQYIDRNALLRQAETMFDGQREVMGVKAEHIYSAPVAEVAEVVHGEWKTEWDAEKDPKKYFIRIVCSNCGLKTGGVANYCPQCGAKMDGGKQDD